MGYAGGIKFTERKSTYRTNAEAVLVVTKQDGVDVNMKTNYMFDSR